MAVPSDNSPETSFTGLSRPTGEGIVIDIGTGDGRFVSAGAKAHPNKFFIGVDANVEPLKKPSMKATRKPTKGGLANALFVQAAVEDLPEEFNRVADEIHIHFPWGSLLRAVASADAQVLSTLRRIAADGCVLEIVIGLDAERDRTEIERLDLPPLDDDHIHGSLVGEYRKAGFEMIECGRLDRGEWSRLETTWAKKLSPNAARSVRYLMFRAV